MKYYRIPRDVELQAKCKNVLKSTGINWHNASICCEHWGKGKGNHDDIPDVIVPPSQLQIHKTKYEKALKRYRRISTPIKEETNKIKILKKKLDTAMAYKNCISKCRKLPVPRIQPETSTSVIPCDFRV